MTFAGEELDLVILDSVQRAVNESRNFTRMSLVAELCEMFCREKKGTITECGHYRIALENRFRILAEAEKITLDIPTGKVAILQKTDS